MVVSKTATTRRAAASIVVPPKIALAQASVYEGMTPFGENLGTFYTPFGGLDSFYSAQGITPEKLIIPREYHAVLQMCYDFYQRGGMATSVINRLSELSITDIRNGQRKTTDEANAYFNAVLHSRPSRLMRFIRTMALEYFISGMVLPKVDWQEMKGSDISPKLKAGKNYMVPVFDAYPPMMVDVGWVGWGKKAFYLRISPEDARIIKNKGGSVKDKQLRYTYLVSVFPDYVNAVNSGANRIEITDSDPILRKEISTTPYPTPYLFNTLEALVFKQQLRRMDFAVASRVTNAILLVQEGDKDFPLTPETEGNMTQLKQQILARSNNSKLMERLFILFSNHTTKLSWITPDVSMMLNQEKYVQTNEEIQEGLGVTRVLITGEARAGTGAEVSTWAVLPMMEEIRSMLLEWVDTVYTQASDFNNFRNLPAPAFKPIRLQDFIKTAAVFAQIYKEGIISRTTRAESVGTDYETETELMRDEEEYSKGLPAFQPTPYSPPPPVMGAKTNGRPIGSQNVPVNKRNSGVKLPGQKPKSQVAISEEEEGLMDDEEFIELLNKIALDRGIVITPEMVQQTPPLMNE
jgi:hypothetical protein